MFAQYVADAFASTSPGILLQGGNTLGFPVLGQFVHSKIAQSNSKQSGKLHEHERSAQNKFNWFLYLTRAIIFVFVCHC